MMYFHSHKTESGFSLVETLVAVSILLLVMIGPMTISVSTARSTSFSSEQVVAFFLAQEGAEIAQKARDALLLNSFAPPSDPDYNPTPWGDFTDETPSGMYTDCFDSSGCGLELKDGDAAGDLKSVVDCASGCKLYRNDGAGTVRSRYTYSATGNEDTGYYRVIKFTNTAADQVRVVSEVSWYSGSFRQKQSVEVETYLFNVYEKN